jgi:hypothetical protein
MYIPLFVLICLMYVQASPPASCNWISPLYDTSRSTQKCIVPRHIFCTSVAFQFHHIPNNLSLPFCDEMTLQYSNSPWTHRKLNALCISAMMHVFVCDFRKGNILSQMQWKGLALRKGTKNFPCNPAWTAMLSLFCPLVKRLEYLTSITKMWN